MDDIMDKIQEVLSDEESMKMINELASSMFSSDDQSDEVEPDNNREESSDDGFNLGNMMAIMSLLGSAENDKNAELLIALKPLLKEERQAKVDKAVKMLKLYSVWTILKDSGMLSDIF